MEIDGRLLAKLLGTLPTRLGGSGAVEALFTPGEIVQAKVLGRIDSQLLLLEIKGHELVARNLVGLKPGQVVEVEVGPASAKAASGGGEVVLHLLSQPGKELSLIRLLKEALPDYKPISPALTRLAQTLKELPTRPQSPLEAETRAVLSALGRTGLQPGADLASRVRELPARLGLDLEPVLGRAVASGRLEPVVRDSLLLGLKPRLIALVRQLEPASAGRQDMAAPFPALAKVVGRLTARLAQAAGAKTAQQARGLAQTQTALFEEAEGTLNRLLALGTEAGPKPGKAEIRARLQEVIKRSWPRLKSATEKAPAGKAARPEALPPTEPSARPPAGPPRAVPASAAVIEEASVRTVRPEAAPESATLTRGERRGALPAAGFPARSPGVSPDPNPALTAAVEELEQALTRLALRLGLTPQALARAALTQAEGALQSLESVQLLNLAASETQTAFLIPLIAPLALGLKAARFHLFKPPAGQAREGEEPLRLVFLLEMTRIGPVRVDLSLIQKRVMINLYTTEEKTAAFARKRIDELSQGLTKLGYQVGAVNAGLLKSAPPIESLTPPPYPVLSHGLIDLRA
ncbi:MAG: hypothetical protein JRC92_02065 [Deltaproteobacteria bacterium]|nr:hypothetical protein [Deltaproteobacteria bacterium]